MGKDNWIGQLDPVLSAAMIANIGFDFKNMKAKVSQAFLLTTWILARALNTDEPKSRANLRQDNFTSMIITWDLSCRSSCTRIQHFLATFPIVYHADNIWG